MAYTVFISYSTSDLQTAETLRDWVVHAGATAFLAEYAVPPGQSLAKEILDAIKQCDLFLLLWSQTAQQSSWVPQEIGVARGLDKEIVPVVLDPYMTLPGFIQDLKYLPLFADPQAAVEWLHADVAKRARAKGVQGAVAVGVLAAIVTALLVTAE